MKIIDHATLQSLPLNSITKVEFYKRDEITSDLIFCDVVVDAMVYSFHENMAGWSLLEEHLAELPTFERDWRNSVVLPAFAECRKIAFHR